jgi:hypothetical protein
VESPRYLEGRDAYWKPRRREMFLWIGWGVLKKKIEIFQVD